MRTRLCSPASLRLISLFLVLLLLLQCMPLPVLGAEFTNIAPNATVTTSYVSPWETLTAIQKTDTPASSGTVTGDQYGNWLSTGNIKTNWVEYSFPETQLIDSSRVYWFEDRQGIYAPEAATLQYFDGNGWIDLGPVGTETDCFNENSFGPIYTQKIRLTMTGAGSNATGIKRWQLLGRSLDGGIGLENAPATIQGSIAVDNMAGTATFSVTVDSDDSQTFYAALSLHDENGSEIAAEKTPFTVEGGKTFSQDFSITVPSALMLKCVVLDEDGLTPVTYVLTSRCAPINDSMAGFTAAEVTLTDSIFKDAQDTGEDFLLGLDVDRLSASVYRYSRKYKNGEIEMPATPYGGWESSGDKGLNGHSVGHYLSACSEMYLQTGNSDYLTRMNRAVDLIAAVQDEDGFVGGFDRQYLDDSLSDPDNISSGGTNGAYLGGIWAPWYSVHKILQGAIDVYNVTGNEKALAIAEGIASYAADKAEPLNDAQMEVMLKGEHGGINESLANLYEITGNPEHIELAKRYSHKAILDPLANGTDNLSGLHANTQIPKVVGAAKIYLLTGDPYYRDAAEYFWKVVVENRSYANGGNSNAEHFTNLGTEPLSETSTETCNTYNMLKLTELLYRIDPKAEYIDYYENALYNHILGSQNPQGHKTYYIDLAQGGHKSYRNAFECCVGTGMENHTRYTHMIYYTDADALLVNLFINSTLHWEEGGMTLTQQTEFPVQDTTTITVDSTSGGKRSIKLRVPEWTKTPRVLVNGEVVDAAEEDGYIILTRDWAVGDTITYTLPMEHSIYVSREAENLIAFKYGPILLAGVLETSVKPIVSNADPATLPVRTSEDALRFEIRESLRPGYESITLKPFYEFNSEQHMVYWTLYTTDEYEAMGGDSYISYIDRMAELTIDRVRPNNSESEQSHGLKVTGTSTVGYAESAGGNWRDAHGDASFSYRLAVEPDGTNYLACAFWGNDTSGVTPRTFDILVDEQIVAEDYNLNHNLPGKIFYQYYKLDPALLEGKESVTVTFRSEEGTIAGGVFDVRTLRARILPEDLSDPYDVYYSAEPTVLGATQGDALQAVDCHYTVDNGWVFAPDTYITIDLQRSHTVKQLMLLPAAELGALPKDCDIYVSNTAPTYTQTDAGTVISGLQEADQVAALSFGEGGFEDAQALPENTEGRYVTIHVRNTQDGNTGAVAEIALEISTETKPEAAAKAAEAAKAAAEAAKASAEAAQAKAEALAEELKADAEAVEKAQAAAQAAQAAAEAARKAAENAQAAANNSNVEAAEYAAQVAEAQAEIAALRLDLLENLEEAARAAGKAALAASKHAAVTTLGIYADDTNIHVSIALESAIEAIEAAQSVDAVGKAVEDAIAAIEAADKNCKLLAFDDLEPITWYHDGIEFMLSKEYMLGVSATAFAPEVTLTRGQLVTILYRVEGKPDVTELENPFTDVAESYYTDAIIWAADAGIVQGTSKTTFAPEAAITREQMATILYRYAKASAVDNDNKRAFPDASAVSSFAEEAVNWALEIGLINGVVSGDETYLQPKATATRAQVAVILYRYLTQG